MIFMRNNYSKLCLFIPSVDFSGLEGDESIQSEYSGACQLYHGGSEGENAADEVRLGRSEHGAGSTETCDIQGDPLRISPSLESIKTESASTLVESRPQSRTNMKTVSRSKLSASKLIFDTPGHVRQCSDTASDESERLTREEGTHSEIPTSLTKASIHDHHDDNDGEDVARPEPNRKWPQFHKFSLLGSF